MRLFTSAVLQSHPKLPASKLPDGPVWPDGVFGSTYVGSLAACLPLLLARCNLMMVHPPLTASRHVPKPHCPQRPEHGRSRAVVATRMTVLQAFERDRLLVVALTSPLPPTGTCCAQTCSTSLPPQPSHVTLPLQLKRQELLQLYPLSVCTVTFQITTSTQSCDLYTTINAQPPLQSIAMVLDQSQWWCIKYDRLLNDHNSLPTSSKPTTWMITPHNTTQHTIPPMQQMHVAVVQPCA